MDDATGALSRVTESPDRSVINVDAARLAARSMLKRTELPEGAALEMTLVQQERVIRQLCCGIVMLSEKEEPGAFRDVAEKVVRFSELALLLNAPFTLDRHTLPRRYSMLIVKLAGAYDLLGGGATCPPAR